VINFNKEKKMALKITVWNEFRHEKSDEAVKKIYPKGLHVPIAEYLKSQGHFVRTATLDEPEHGLTEEVLANTDVLTWWGHMAHGEVQDSIVEKVQRRVLDGMGLLVLHSGHVSKIFRKLLGTGCDLNWREIGEKERIWIVEPGHPICEGLPKQFVIPHEEMYGERFDIPAPDTLVMISWFEGGDVFRSGCCFQRGRGKIFYFRPGHETLPTYYQAEVLKVIGNAVRWLAPTLAEPDVLGNWRDPLEKVSSE
jgi:trehalose utilization protein